MKMLPVVTSKSCP